MKIRLGFVSNSSSASYFIRVKNVNINNLIKELVNSGNFYDYIDKDRLIEEIDKSIENDKSYITNSKSLAKTQNVFDDLCRNRIRELTKKKATVMSINENAADTIFKLQLEFNHIQFRNEDRDAIFAYFTIMHNNFDEGMHSLLKEIVLFLNFHSKYKIEYQIDKDEQQGDI